MEKGHTLNTLFTKIRGDEGNLMEPGVYFVLIINVLMVVTFIALILAFLYMIYGKEREEKTE